MVQPQEWSRIGSHALWRNAKIRGNVGKLPTMVLRSGKMVAVCEVVIWVLCAMQTACNDDELINQVSDQAL